MKIVSWNIRGMGKKNKGSLLGKVVYNNHADIIVIQETMVNIVRRPVLNSVWPHNSFDGIQIPAEGRSGGLASLWKLESFSLMLHWGTKRWLAVRGTIIKENINLSQNWNYPICFMGDFNSITHLEDKLHCTIDEQNMLNFNDFISNANLFDVPIHNYKFTRFGRQDSNGMIYLDDQIKSHLQKLELDPIDEVAETSLMQLIQSKNEVKRRLLLKCKTASNLKWLHIGDKNSREACSIDRELFEEEVWEVVSSFDGGKAPGPDGFSMEFFKRACISSVHFSILINNSASKEGVMGRGLRQDDPLSPFLLILVAEFAVLMGCSVGSFPFEYLGIPIGTNPRRINAWQKGGNISKRKIHLVSWKIVCKPKELGGLGVVPLRVKNMALLTSWWGKYNENRSALWKMVITKSYARSFPSKLSELHFIPPHSRVSSVWKNIINIKKENDVLRILGPQTRKWNVGAGNQVFFGTIGGLEVQGYVLSSVSSGRACLRVCVSTRRGDNLTRSIRCVLVRVKLVNLIVKFQQPLSCWNILPAIFLLRGQGLLNVLCFSYRKGFLEDDESSDDSIFIVDPGWDDYSLQAIKSNRPISLCPEARRARM
ncbi:RNA-directed DNA polymerase, eukaryota [Tanacetum coccineum]